MRMQGNRERQAESLAVGLGWFSVALGLAELAVPRELSGLIGLPEDDETAISALRACGARELANGLAILSEPDRAAWLWSRVGGDAIDLSLIGSAYRRDDADTKRLGAAAAAVAGVTALDALCAVWLSGAGNRDLRRLALAGGRDERSVRVEHVTTINKPIEEVYAFWRNFQNLPRFMRHLESVEVTGGARSRWRAKAPAGTTVEWEADIVAEREPEWIAWQSVPGSGIQNSGAVRFERAPGARGTEVRVQLEYRPPAGTIGRGIAWLFGEEPDQQVKEDLHRFKQLMETGEVPLSEGFGLWRPAQPVADPNEVRTLAGVQS
jgi:uncharacterized membrane protein